MQVVQSQMIEGTTEEITLLLQKGVFAGQKLRVFVEPENELEPWEDTLPDPPFTVRSQEHLLELLREGMNSPASKFTDETLEQMRQEVRKRHAAKHQP